MFTKLVLFAILVFFILQILFYFHLQLDHAKELNELLKKELDSQSKYKEELQKKFDQQLYSQTKSLSERSEGIEGRESALIDHGVVGAVHKDNVIFNQGSLGNDANSLAQRAKGDVVGKVLQKKHSDYSVEKAQHYDPSKRKPVKLLRQQEGFEDNHHGNRIAVIIPYVGNSLPFWFDAFAQSCRQSASLADWLIFHDETLVTVQTPSNVKLINLGTKGLMRSFSKIVEPVSDQRKFEELLPSMLKSYAYMMVEFKPAYGYMFEDHLTNYSHWAYADLDLINGNLVGWIEEEELKEYDIFTLSFGDQYRAYARGQLTIHRNIAKVNHIWHKCAFMHQVYQRAKSKKFHYQSGEGCYSSMIAGTSNLKMKYSVKVFTDASGKDVSETDKEVLYRDGDVIKCPSEILGGILTGDAQVSGYFSYPIQVPAEPLVPVEPEHNGKCMFWVHPKFQSNICLQNVTGSDNVVLQNKRFFKQQYRNNYDPICKRGAFFHFQNWKSNYRYWNTRPAPFFSRGMLMSANGFIPIPPLSKEGLQDWASQFKSAQTHDQTAGKLYCPQYEDKSSQRKVSVKCSRWIRWQDAKVILNNFENTAAESITLILTGHIDYLPNFIQNANHWGPSRPIILLVHISTTSHTEEMVKKLEQRLSELTAGWSQAIVAYIRTTDHDEMHAVLLNMAKDHTRTRFILPVPQHFVLNGNSRELLMQYTSQWEKPGNSRSIGVIPSWALQSSCSEHKEDLGEEKVLDFQRLKAKTVNGTAHIYLKNTGESKLCSGMAKNCKEIQQPIPENKLQNWLDTPVSAVFSEALAVRWDDAGHEDSNSSLFKKIGKYSNPILLIDMWSYHGSSWVRFIEELGSFGCSGILYPWILQTLGYQFHLLPQVFAVLKEPHNFSNNGGLHPQVMNCNCLTSEKATHFILEKAWSYFQRIAEVNGIVSGDGKRHRISHSSQGTKTD